MRSFDNVNVLIVLLLILAASAAWNLQETLNLLDWLYASVTWLLRQVARQV
jgi:hypothetical protein